MDFNIDLLYQPSTKAQTESWLVQYSIQGTLVPSLTLVQRQYLELFYNSGAFVTRLILDWLVTKSVML
jgi:hypothetical protein